MCAGICHRDVKSSNYLVRGRHQRPSGSEIELCLGDFGECVPVEELTASTWNEEGLIASSGFTAPELLSQRPPPYSQAADVWSLGVVLWEILTQSCVHDGSGVVWGEASDKMVSTSVHALCEAALEELPEHRPSAAELGATLKSQIR